MPYFSTYILILENSLQNTGISNWIYEQLLIPSIYAIA